MKTIRALPILTTSQTEALYKTFLTEDNIKQLITEDIDVYTNSGRLLARFRKNILSLDVLKAGVEAFRGSIMLTEGRGAASGFSGKRILKDGTVSNITVGKMVTSGAVGYMDENAMIKYCRKTAFTKEHFETFKQGIPFVKAIDELYKHLTPAHYLRQINMARSTNKNYVIADTAFTTVTVNKNFQTAVHKDAGDFPKGFGNLIAYRTGNWTGSYFCLPQYGLAFDLQNTDVLFVDVHEFHGNTPFNNFSPDAGDERISFVLYYREYMYKCLAPKQELRRVQDDRGGFHKL